MITMSTLYSSVSLRDISRSSHHHRSSHLLNCFYYLTNCHLLIRQSSKVHTSIDSYFYLSITFWLARTDLNLYLYLRLSSQSWLPWCWYYHLASSLCPSFYPCHIYLGSNRSIELPFGSWLELSGGQGSLCSMLGPNGPWNHQGNKISSYVGLHF